MANERYVQKVQPSLGEKAWSAGETALEKGGQFVRHADDAIDMAPPAAAVWLAVIVALAAYKVTSSLGKNIGPRDGAARFVRGAVYCGITWMAASCAHDSFLESKGYAVNGNQSSHEQIRVSPRTADFERAAKPYKRTYDYAPTYSSDGATVSSERSVTRRVREVEPEVPSAERRHNKPIVQPQ